MKLVMDIPEDQTWLQKFLVDCYQAAEQRMADGSVDPRWAQGYFACIKEMIANVELEFAEQKAEHEAKYGGEQPNA